MKELTQEIKAELSGKSSGEVRDKLTELHVNDYNVALYLFEVLKTPAVSRYPDSFVFSHVPLEDKKVIVYHLRTKEPTAFFYQRTSEGTFKPFGPTQYDIELENMLKAYSSSRPTLSRNV